MNVQLHTYFYLHIQNGIYGDISEVGEVLRLKN